MQDAVPTLRLVQLDRAEARLAERDGARVHRHVEGGDRRWARSIEGLGTLILKSLGLDVVSFHVEEAPSTLWAVRETVTTPGMFGW